MEIIRDVVLDTVQTAGAADKFFSKLLEMWFPV
jgi:hypothetical protein